VTDDEWRAICLHIEQPFKGEFPDEARAAYATFLRGRDFGDVLAGLRKLVEDGQVFTPSAGEIVTAIKALRDPPVPSWSEVWHQIELAMKDQHQELHPIIARFIESEGLQTLRRAPFYDPDKGDMRVHQLHVRWIEFVEVQQAREVRQAALTASGHPALEHRTELLEASIEAGP